MKILQSFLWVLVWNISSWYKHMQEMRNWHAKGSISVTNLFSICLAVIGSILADAGCSQHSLCWTSFYSLDTFVNHPQTYQRNTSISVPINHSNYYTWNKHMLFYMANAVFFPSLIKLKRHLACQPYRASVLFIFYRQIAQRASFLFFYAEFILLIITNSTCI